MAGSPLTIATLLARFEDCSATTVTSPSGTVILKSSSLRPLDTFEIAPDPIVAIVPAGYEDVFDIEVERTENFIADGVVSHNTRWHEDDLIGRILAEPDADQWKVVRLPLVAEDEEADALGRAPGEFLWEPHEQPFGEIPTEEVVGRQTYAAQYQQRPVALQGNLLQEEDLRDLPATFYEPSADDHDPRSLFQRLWRFQTWDTAFSESDKADRSVGMSWGVDARMNVYLLDVIRMRVSTGTALQPMTEFWDTWKPPVVIIERPAFRQKQVDALAAELRTKIMAVVVPLAVGGEGDKEDRFGLFVGRAKASTVFVDKSKPWYRDVFWPEIAGFPKMKFDDVPDCASLLFVYLNQHARPEKPKTTKYHVGSGRRRPTVNQASKDLWRELMGGGVKR